MSLPSGFYDYQDGECTESIRNLLAEVVGLTFNLSFKERGDFRARSYNGARIKTTIRQCGRSALTVRPAYCSVGQLD